MPSRKRIVCRCIDVTFEEVANAIARGRRDVESLKRKTGIGTGPCQGKACVLHVLEMLARATGKSLDELGTMKPRQPAQSIELGILSEAGSKGKKRTAEAR